MDEKDLKNLVEKFNIMVERDEKVRKEIEGKNRTVQISLGDKSYYLRLENAKIVDYGEGVVEGGADITVISDTQTMSALLSKEMTPWKAYARGKLRIKASLDDLLLLKNLVG